MRATTTLMLACGLLALMPPAAVAQTFTPVPHGSHVIDLDTAAAAFSIWSTDDLSGVDAIRAKFAMRQMRADKQWAPSFRFALTNGDESVALIGTGIKAKRAMILSLVHFKNGQVVSEEMFLTHLMIDEVADLEIDWQPSGLVSVSVKSPQSLSISAAGENHEVRMTVAPTGFEVSASTGELEVKSLRLGAIVP